MQERAATRPRPPAGQAEAADGVHRLVERLLREVKRTSRRVRDPAAPDYGSSQVLLNVEVDGLRVVVTREALQEAPRIVLSPREYEVARMVARGYPNKTIASVLEISPWTVSTHLRRIFAKLDVASRAAMVAKLLEGGILRAHPPAAP